jgi:putative phosphoserine phosphatase/1-acylglycerol-3-phosphate O-acyltransferase
MDAIADQLPPEARRPHTPTAEELARTYPPGRSPNGTDEATRRPGQD